MKWRIYRLPGSREWWMIDHGPGSLILFAHHWEILPEVLLIKSGHGDPQLTPREWIEVEGADITLHEYDGRLVASFTRASVPAEAKRR